MSSTPHFVGFKLFVATVAVSIGTLLISLDQFILCRRKTRPFMAGM